MRRELRGGRAGVGEIGVLWQNPPAAAGRLGYGGVSRTTGAARKKGAYPIRWATRGRLQLEEVVTKLPAIPLGSQVWVPTCQSTLWRGFSGRSSTLERDTFYAIDDD